MSIWLRVIETPCLDNYATNHRREEEPEQPIDSKGLIFRCHDLSKVVPITIILKRG